MATPFFGDGRSTAPRGRNEVDVRPRRRWLSVRRGEPSTATAPEVTGQWLSMARDDTCCVIDVCDFPVRCREGTLWVTSPEDPGDTVVAAGEQLSVTSRGTILVVALAPSSMWAPQGFAVHDAEGTSKRRMSRIFPASTDAAEAPRSFLRGVFQQVVAGLARRSSPGTGDARERYLSQSVDHADFENRIRAWDAHEERLRCLPPVL